MYSFRPLASKIPSSSLYFATVLLEMEIPFSASFSPRMRSLYGFFLFSSSNDLMEELFYFVAVISLPDCLVFQKQKLLRFWRRRNS